MKGFLILDNFTLAISEIVAIGIVQEGTQITTKNDDVSFISKLPYLTVLERLRVAVYDSAN